MFKKLQLSMLGAAMLAGMPNVMTAQTAPDEVVLMGNVINFIGEEGMYSTDLGIYSFNADPSGASSFTAVYKSHLMYSNSGAINAKDRFYSFYSRFDDFDDLTPCIIVRTYNNETWELIEKKEYPVNSGLESYDMCYSPSDDKYYGIFKSLVQGDDETSDEDDYDETRLGTIDLNTMEITYISQEPLPNLIYGLAASPEGDIYGILPVDVQTGKGALVKFDKTNGTYSVVGSLGFKTQFRRMSATIDQRTGKMYWVGYINDGIDPETGTHSRDYNKVALYEVNLTTGAAVKIYDMPYKCVISGLYVKDGDRNLTGIGTISAESLNKDAVANIYSTNGQLVFTGKAADAQLQRGIYIIRQGENACKMIVR